MHTGACPGGGPKGPGLLPRIKLKSKKKKKKRSSEQILSYFHLYFATFLVENFIFSAIF